MFEKLKPLLPKSDKSAEEAFKTGDWRTLKPEMRVKNSACWLACPVHNPIRDCLQLAAKEEFEKAWQKLIETNPLPAVLGRVCPHPCETECLRSKFDQPLAINTIEKLLGDMALEKKWKPKGFSELEPRLRMRHHIAIIGGGPAGLACAYQWRRMGHRSEIFEAEKELGGMLYFGIPAYRLEKEILKKEIENNILSLGGIKISSGTRINGSMWVDMLNEFDVVLVAVGKQRSRKIDLGMKQNDPRIFSGLEFLRRVNSGEKFHAGDMVAVVGGGNTAIDAARMAKRNGAKCVIVVYRRREEDMPAFPEEIRMAQEEGIEILPLVLPNRIEEWQGLLKIDCSKMALGKPDETGRPEPIPQKESLISFFVNNLIIAVGEDTDLSFALNSADEKLALECAFLAGDASQSGAGTVSGAIGSGNMVAAEIDFYLKNGRRKYPEPVESEVVEFSDLNAEYFDFIFQQAKGYLAEKRKPEDRICEEAKRCFSCGLCNHCGNCWLYCPDIAVRQKQNGGYEINYDYCKGCGICANECPRNAIDMESEVS